LISRRSFLGLVLSSFGLVLLPRLGWSRLNGYVGDWFPGVYGLGPI
jgi:hypothetical protein